MGIALRFLLSLFLFAIPGCAQTLTITGHLAPFNGKLKLCDCQSGTQATVQLQLSHYIYTSSKVFDKATAEYPLGNSPVGSGFQISDFVDNSAVITIGTDSWRTSDIGVQDNSLLFTKWGTELGVFQALEGHPHVYRLSVPTSLATLVLDLRTPNSSSSLWNVTGSTVNFQTSSNSRFGLVSPTGERAIFTVDTVSAAPVVVTPTVRTTTAFTANTLILGRDQRSEWTPKVAFLSSTSTANRAAYSKSYQDLIRVVEEIEHETTPGIGKTALTPYFEASLQRIPLAIAIYALWRAVKPTELDEGEAEFLQKLDDSLKRQDCSRTMPMMVYSHGAFPNIATHIAIAQVQHPEWRVLTIARLPIDIQPLSVQSRRYQACKNASRIGLSGENLTCDEYPFASTAEGGSGASVWPVSQAEQNDQSQLINRFYNTPLKKPNGTKFCVRVIP